MPTPHFRSWSAATRERACATCGCRGELLYAADRAGSVLRVLDVSDRAQPVELTAFDTPGLPWTVPVAGSIAFVGDDWVGLSVLDVADQGRGLVVVDQLDPATPRVVLFIVDVRNPTAPLFAGSDRAPGRSEHVVVRDGIAYVADGAAGTTILDVSNPAATSVLSRVDPDGPFDGDALAVAVLGPRACLADDLQQQIDVVQIADPAHLRPNNQVNAAGRPSEILVTGDTPVLAASDGGRRCFHRGVIPSLPIEVVSLPFDQDAASSHGVGVRSGFAWIVDPLEGGYLARHTGQCRDPFEPNDHPDLAAPTPADAPQTAKICDQTDRDLFAAAVAAGGALNMSMTPPAGRNYDLVACDPARKLIGSSAGGGPGQPESLALTVIDPGAYRIEVHGAKKADYASAATYTLTYMFDACPAPPLEVRITAVALDGADDVVLTVVDPNAPVAATGYNVYCADAAAGPFVRVATNASDANGAIPGIHLVDTGSAATAPLFYRVAAFNGVCGGEGPR